MATIAVAPFVINDVLFTVGTDSYQSHVSSVKFTPSSSVKTWTGLTPTATFTRPGVTTWTCDVTLAQDWETANSLAQYLLNKAKTAPQTPITVLFEPINNGSSFSANIYPAAPQVGGDGDNWATAQVSMGVDGWPTLVVS